MQFGRLNVLVRNAIIIRLQKSYSWVTLKGAAVRSSGKYVFLYRARKCYFSLSPSHPISPLFSSSSFTHPSSVYKCLAISTADGTSARQRHGIGRSAIILSTEKLVFWQTLLFPAHVVDNLTDCRLKSVFRPVHLLGPRRSCIFHGPCDRPASNNKFASTRLTVRLVPTPSFTLDYCCGRRQYTRGPSVLNAIYYYTRPTNTSRIVIKFRKYFRKPRFSCYICSNINKQKLAYTVWLKLAVIMLG